MPKKKKVSQINPNKESGGKQPYQQNRIYDTDGLAPALCANKSDLLIKEKRGIKQLGNLYNQTTRWGIYDENGISPCITASMGMGGGHIPMIVDDSNIEKVVVHNTMPRSSKTGKGGTGPLSRSDGKTYCLDTGNTNAIQIFPADYRSDEGIRIRENGKAPTLTRGAETSGTQYNSLAIIGPRIRRLTPKECMRLQTVDDSYLMPISDSQKYKCLGNGWTVDVVSHIFSYLKTNNESK